MKRRLAPTATSALATDGSPFAYCPVGVTDRREGDCEDRAFPKPGTCDA